MNDILIKYRLIHASPEYVLNFIEENKFKFRELEHLQEILYERNEPLINLAIALYGFNIKVICSIYDSGDLGLQTACMEGCLFSMKGYDTDTNHWLNSKDYISKLTKNATVSDLDSGYEINAEAQLLKTLITNPECSTEILTQFINRKWQFSEIKDSVFRYILIESISNKQSGISNEIYDSDLATALWNLTLTLDVNIDNAILLINLLDKLQLSYSTYISSEIDFLSAAKRWFAPCESETISEPINLHLFYNKAFYDYNFESPYQYLRLVVARRYTYDSDDFDKLSQIDDRPIRIAFYESFNFWKLNMEGSTDKDAQDELENIKKRYNKDGHYYLAALEKNTQLNFYLLKGSLKEIAECAKDNYLKDKTNAYNQSLFEYFKELCPPELVDELESHVVLDISEKKESSKWLKADKSDIKLKVVNSILVLCFILVLIITVRKF